MKKYIADQLMNLTRKSYETVSSAFSATRRFSWDDCTPLEWIVKDGTSVLDIGCGNGRMINFFKKKNIHYTGIDLNQYFIQFAQEKFGGKGREFYQSDVLELHDLPELAGRKYDTVFSIAALHHLPSAELRLRVLTTLYDFLTPGGILFLTVWNLWRATLKEKSVWKYAIERSLLDQQSYERDYGIDYRELSWRDLMTLWKAGGVSVPLYYYTFRCTELTGLCKRTGFDVVDCYYSKKGNRAHWWDGENICLIARKK